MKTKIGKPGVRYAVNTRRELWAAAWSGFLDGRKGLPSGEAQAGQLPPACAALHAQYSSLLARLEVDYRSAEAGYARALQRAASAAWETPQGDPSAVGPAGRGTRRALGRQASDISAGIQAADDLLAMHAVAMAKYATAQALAGRAMSVYTRHLYRWHPQRADLSVHSWLPPAFPMPHERVGMRPDLAALIRQVNDAQSSVLISSQE